MFESIIKEEFLDLVRKAWPQNDVDTRWNSCYLMLVQSFHFQQVFESWHTKDPMASTLIDNLEWEETKLVAGCLEHLYIYTLQVSVQNKQSIHLVLPLNLRLREHIIDLAKHPLPSVSVGGELMFQKFQEYFVEADNKLFVLAFLLDPRYKLGFLK